MLLPIGLVKNVTSRYRKLIVTWSLVLAADEEAWCSYNTYGKPT